MITLTITPKFASLALTALYLLTFAAWLQPQAEATQGAAPADELRRVAITSSEQPLLRTLRDMWLLSAEHLDADIELYQLPRDEFNAALNQLGSATTPSIDWFVGLSETQIEAAGLHLGPIVLTCHFELYQRRQLAQLSSVADAEGYVVGVVNNSPAEDWLRQHYPQLFLRTYPSQQAMLSAALEGNLHVYASASQLSGGSVDTPQVTSQAGGTEPMSLNYLFPQSRRLPLFSQDLYVGMREPGDEGAVAGAFAAVADERQRYLLERANRAIANLVSLQADELEWLASRDQIVVGVPTDSRPILFFDADGEARGLDADFLTLVSQRSNLDFRFSACGNWEACLKALAERDIDVLSFVSDIPERRGYAAFTSPYWETPWAIASAVVGSIGADRLADIDHKRIAITRSYSLFEEASQLPNLEVIAVDSPEEGLAAVQAGRAEGYLDSLPLLVERVREQQTGNLYLSVLHGEPGDIVSFAVRSDWPVLRDVLDRVVQTLSADDQQRIAERWFDVNVERGLSFAEVRRWLLYTAALSALLIGFFVLWNSRLRREVKRRHIAEDRMRHFARHDDLTGLPNRHLLEDRMQQVLASHQRYQRQFAVLFLDLDGFKDVNDAHGHEVGDALLKQVARRLSDSVRAQDTVCRFGGDEFIVILTELQQAAQAMKVAQKLVDSVTKPYSLTLPSAGAAAPPEALTAQVSVSIGVAMFPGHGRDGAELLRLADKAMYDVKREGKNGVRMAPGLQ